MLNAKGGCGKTTLATSLAACAARRGRSVRLLDLDPLGAALAWGRRRPESLPSVHVLAADRVPLGVTRSFLLGAAGNEEITIFDTPAGLGRPTLDLLVRDAAAVLVPVLPSTLDTTAAPRTIADVLLTGCLPETVAVVANRIRPNTRAYAALVRFLDSLTIPLVTVLHDSQSYVAAVAEGRGIHELATPAARAECRRWKPLLDWLAGRGLVFVDPATAEGANTPPPIAALHPETSPSIVDPPGDPSLPQKGSPP